MSIRKTLYREVAKQSGVPYRGVVRVLDESSKLFRQELRRQGRVEVRGIGIFTTGKMGDEPTVFFVPSKGGEKST